MFNKQLVVIDLETSGPTLEYDIIQFGAVKLDKDFNIIEIFEKLVKPTNELWDKDSFKVHKIERERCVLDGISINDCIEKFEHFVGMTRNFSLSCVDENTMAMTSNGLKSYTDLNVGDKILTFNLNNKKLEYQPILKLNVQNYNGKMYSYTRYNKEYLFTPNHNFIYSNWTGKKEKITYNIVDDIWKEKRRMYIPQFDCLDSKKEYFSDDYIKLIAWILSEGTISKSYIAKNPTSKWKSYSILIHQSKKSKYYNEIRSLLNRLGLEFSIRTCETVNRFYIKAKHNNYILNNVTKYHIPSWLFKSTTRQKKIFIDEYIKGDGCKNIITFGKDRLCFAQEIQKLITECGYTSRLGIDISKSRYGINKQVYRLVIFKAPGFCITANKIIQYSGKVWCPTTKNGTWIAYRNGIPFVTGNSWGIFDINMLTTVYKRLDKKFIFSYRIYDISSIVRFIRWSKNMDIHKSIGLYDSSKSLGLPIDVNSMHNALYDAELTARALRECYKLLSKGGVNENYQV